MSLKNIVVEELKRTPVAAASGAIGAAVALISMVAAWLQPRSNIPSPSPTAGPPVPASDLVLGNLSLCIAYFVGITVAAAFVLRAIGRRHDIAALLASAPVASLTNFSTILMLYLAPPRELNGQLFSSAHDLILYASASIFLAICGSAILGNIAATAGRNSASSSSDTKHNGDGLAVLLIFLVLLAAWTSVVSAGQARLTRTFLPEITHPAETKASAERTEGK